MNLIRKIIAAGLAAGTLAVPLGLTAAASPAPAAAQQQPGLLYHA